MSVIIPVFNVCAYIEEALESVIGQTYKKLEILLIDDGSTDGSGDICNQYSERDSREPLHFSTYRPCYNISICLDIYSISDTRTTY